jgi:hypothetical protein
MILARMAKSHAEMLDLAILWGNQGRQYTLLKMLEKTDRDLMKLLDWPQPYATLVKRGNRRLKSEDKLILTRELNRLTAQMELVSPIVDSDTRALFTAIMELAKR